MGGRRGRRVLIGRPGPVAEDLTSETFLAAVDAVKGGAVADLTVASLIGSAARATTVR